MIVDHIRNELAPPGRAYADCKVWNKPAIRCIEKAGFRRIATKHPLNRQEVVG
jgi:RimJ/RimL family protein N-acetyltransferase